MSSLQTKSHTPIPFVGPVAMLMVIVLSSSFAHGSCGHYVLRGGLHKGSASGEDPVARVENVQRLPAASSVHTGTDGQRSSLVAGEMDWSQERVPQNPCTGPGCRSLPGNPELPAGVVPFSGRSLDVQAIVSDENIAMPGECGRPGFESRHSKRAGFPPSIDVPPECV